MANLSEKARDILVFFHGQGKCALNPKIQTWNVVGFHSKVSLGGESGEPRQGRVLGLTGFPNQVFASF